MSSDMDFFEAAEEMPIVELGPPFVAQFDGDCSGCLGEIRAGERIRADGHGGWVHRDNLCEAS